MCLMPVTDGAKMQLLDEIQGVLQCAKLLFPRTTGLQGPLSFSHCVGHSASCGSRRRLLANRSSQRGTNGGLDQWGDRCNARIG